MFALPYFRICHRNNDVDRHRGWHNRRRGKIKRQFDMLLQGPNSTYRRSHGDVPRVRRLVDRVSYKTNASYGHRARRFGARMRDRSIKSPLQVLADFTRS